MAKKEPKTVVIARIPTDLHNTVKQLSTSLDMTITAAVKQGLELWIKKRWDEFDVKNKLKLRKP